MNDKSCSKFLQREETKHKEFMGAAGSDAANICEEVATLQSRSGPTQPV